MTDEGETSDCDGDGPPWWPSWRWTTEVASESMVYSDGALDFFFLTGVDVLLGVLVLPGGRALEGLAVLVRWGRCGDFARTVLGWEPVVEVRSVSLKVSFSLMLEREANRGPA